MKQQIKARYIEEVDYLFWLLQIHKVSFRNLDLLDKSDCPVGSKHWRSLFEDVMLEIPSFLAALGLESGAQGLTEGVGDQTSGWSTVDRGFWQQPPYFDRFTREEGRMNSALPICLSHEVETDEPVADRGVLINSRRVGIHVITVVNDIPIIGYPFQLVKYRLGLKDVYHPDYFDNREKLFCVLSTMDGTILSHLRNGLEPRSRSLSFTPSQD